MGGLREKGSLWPGWKKLLAILFILTCLHAAPFAYANGIGPNMSGQPPPTVTQPTESGASIGSSVGLAQDQYRSISQNALEQEWNQLTTRYGGYLPVTSGGFAQAFMPGGQPFSFGALAQGLIQYLFAVLWDNSRLLGIILILTVLAAVLETLQNSFESELVSKVAFMMVHLTLIILAISSFRSAIGYAEGAIGDMTSVMYGSLPILLALITASGGLTSAAVFHPLIVFAVNAVALVVQKWVFPMIVLSAVLMIVSAISSRYKLTELAGFIRTVTLTVLGLGMSVFLGVMATQGSLAGIADGVSLRGVKFVASNLIPVVGKALSDASESIAGASMLVKNATGLASAIILLVICAFPALKILALSMVYGGSAALMQPLGTSPVIASLSTISKSLVLVFAALAAVGLMFFFSLVIAISTSNLTAFVR